MPDYVFVMQVTDGPVYTRVFASPEAFLTAYADYLAEEPELESAYQDAAKQIQECGTDEPVYIESHTSLMKVRIER